MRAASPDQHASAGRDPDDRTGSRGVRVLVADDYQPLLDRVVTLLSREFTVVGAVQNGEEAVEAASRLRPDVLVLDISMPGLSGLKAATRLAASGSVMAVVFLSVNDEPEFVLAAWRAGALGFVSKSDLGPDLVTAVRAVLEGRRFVSASIASRQLP
jgi:DNA-binding NarL/FixJ family response regulator